MQVYLDQESSLSFWWPGPLLSHPVYLAIYNRFLTLDIPKGICEVTYGEWGYANVSLTHFPCMHALRLFGTAQALSLMVVV